MPHPAPPVRLLAEQRERWVILSERPADPENPTPAELDAGIRAECFFTTNTRISATGSTTVNEASLCDAASAQSPSGRQWDGTIEAFHSLDPDTGLPVAEGQPVLEALDAYGEKLWLARLRGPMFTTPIESGQPGKLFEVVMDAEQDPSDRTGSFKSVFPLFVHNEWRFTVAAGA